MSNEMRYEKAYDQFDRYLTADWGKFCAYFELADDLYVSRQVSVYESGNCLRYDRENWRDAIGELAPAKSTPKYEAACRKEWRVEEITAEDFERVWEAAAAAPNQPQEYIVLDEDSKQWVRRMSPEQRMCQPPWRRS